MGLGCLDRYFVKLYTLLGKTDRSLFLRCSGRGISVNVAPLGLKIR